VIYKPTRFSGWVIDVIEVRWDCGRGLSLLPYIDKFEVFDKEEKKNEN